MGTPEFDKSRDQRKRVEMSFADLKTHHRFERMRLRGLSGALRPVSRAEPENAGKHIWRSRPDEPAACVV
jgi:hypothetical protein